MEHAASIDEQKWRKAPMISLEHAASGRYASRRNRSDYPIPNNLNLVLAAAQMVAALTLLSLASHVRNDCVVFGYAFCFAFVMQCGFCLAHEVVHRKLHSHRGLNLCLGIVLFSFFPGSLHFFEVAHLLHHRRNRSDDELEDYVLPGETAWLKRMVYYLLISGLFWLLLPLSSIVVALIPLQRIRLPQPDVNAGSFRKFAQFLNGVRPGRVRRDLLVAAIVWTAAIAELHLRLGALAICYAVFGFSWASQQYIYHVRTPRHAVLGALDLKIWKPLGWLYLHFNYHLTHHLAMWVPWNYLPAVASQAPEQSYAATYARLFKPPEKLEYAWPNEYQTEGPLPSKPDHRMNPNMELPW